MKIIVINFHQHSMILIEGDGCFQQFSVNPNKASTSIDYFDLSVLVLVHTSKIILFSIAPKFTP